jgi:carbamoyltransferase
VCSSDLDSRTWSVFKNDVLVDYGTLDNGSIGMGMGDMGRTLGITASTAPDIAGKLVSLQSYGTIDIKFLDKIKYYTIKDANKIFDPYAWVDHVGDLTLAQCNLINWAATVNYAMHNVLLNYFKLHANPDDIITYSGGVAQNVVWNTTLKKHFKNLTVIPHSCDEGLSIGGIQWAANRFGIELKINNFPYAQCDEAPLDKPSEEIINKVAEFLSQGKTVGWYQGHGEIGPRALGNRSILMDPRLKNGKSIINKIKNRENYRPFGASVLQEFKDLYFNIDWNDPYMLYTAKVKSEIFPAITHIDNTCRIQTVNETNPLFKTLIEKFYSITRCPVLLNTSLNVAGRPIAGSPKDALELFNNSCLDILVVGNTLYDKGLVHENTHRSTQG